MRGLSYMKGQEPTLSKEDDEYPSWLWGLLDDGRAKGGEGTLTKGHLAGMSTICPCYTSTPSRRSHTYN
jgi:hypothetical protein